MSLMSRGQYHYHDIYAQLTTMSHQAIDVTTVNISIESLADENGINESRSLYFEMKCKSNMTTMMFTSASQKQTCIDTVERIFQGSLVEDLLTKFDERSLSSTSLRP